MQNLTSSACFAWHLQEFRAHVPGQTSVSVFLFVFNLLRPLVHRYALLRKTNWSEARHQSKYNIQSLRERVCVCVSDAWMLFLWPLLEKRRTGITYTGSSESFMLALTPFLLLFLLLCLRQSLFASLLFPPYTHKGEAIEGTKGRNENVTNDRLENDAWDPSIFLSLSLPFSLSSFVHKN